MAASHLAQLVSQAAAEGLIVKSAPMVEVPKPEPANLQGQLAKLKRIGEEKQRTIDLLRWSLRRRNAHIESLNEKIMELRNDLKDAEKKYRQAERSVMLSVILRRTKLAGMLKAAEAQQ